jgi:hypothetical protein
MTLREMAARAAAALRIGSGARREADLAQELRFHQDMLEERHRAAGMDPQSARRAARLDLGGGAQIAEQWRDQRSLPVVETLWQDVR